ncbi:MAG: NAD(+) diphosphatase [Casimicrobiaceae bacterium]
MHTPDGFTPLHAMPATLGTSTLAFAYRDGKILVASALNEAPSIPTLHMFSLSAAPGSAHFLGTLGGTACVAVNLADDFQEPAGMCFTGLRSLFLTLSEPLLALAGRAYQIVEWDRTHRFCGRCGTPTRDKAGERAKECPACGQTAYPRVSPAMMVLVTRGRELLLARANRFPTAMYSALAGFVEPGETIEDCIRREVREEVGVEVNAITYFASQSWAFPHSLMIAYNAEYVSGELAPDGIEIADVQWFTLDALPQLPSPVSIARHLIEATVARLRNGR